MRYLLVLCAILAQQAVAEVNVEVGAMAASNAEVERSFEYMMRLSNNDDPYYVWLSHENTETRMLGQGVADLDIMTIGVGVKEKWQDITVFFEAGYALIRADENDAIRDEIVYTTLVNNHALAGPIGIPADHPRPGNDSKTVYEIEDAFVGRVGMGYEITDHLRATLSYKFMSLSEHYELFDESFRADTGKYWQETVTTNANALEIGLFWEF